MKTLAVDITNVLYRGFYVHQQEDPLIQAALATHSALLTLNKYYKSQKPDIVVLAFDRPNNWRKQYTKTDKCVSGRLYKGTRRTDQTTSEKEKFEQFITHIQTFEEFVKEHTTFRILARDGLEADDLLGGLCQVLSMEPGNEITVLSTDNDFLQLLRYPGVTLLSPDGGKKKSLKDWNNDADLFMFEKCIRGDKSDNVQSAYPRLRRQKILAAYEDPMIHTEIMQHTWTDQDENEFLVQDLFKENQLLMDLTKQPDEIQVKIMDTILKGMDSHGTFSHFHFLRYCGQMQMRKLAEQAESFVPLMSANSLITL